MPNRFRPSGPDHGVTSLELYFDLIFVFALTQVTAMMASDLTFVGLLKGVVILGLIWWSWEAFAWLGATAKADEGVVRGGLILAMFAVFLVGLAIPRGFEPVGAGPLVLAAAISVVWLTHLVIYWVVSEGVRELRRALMGLTRPVLMGLVPLFLGAAAGGSIQVVLWVIAIIIPFVGVFVGGVGGWQLAAPAYYAERHGLIVMIALGESIVALGVTASGYDMSWRVVTAVLLGLAVATALWWSYFDVAAKAAEHVLTRATGEARIAIARDSYTFLHYPMVAGVVLLALGLKKVVTYVGDPHYGLGEPLDIVAGAALVGGVVLFLSAQVAFRWRNTHSVSPARTVALALLVVVGLAAVVAPALVVLVSVAMILVATVGFESVAYAGVRREIRDR